MTEKPYEMSKLTNDENDLLEIELINIEMPAIEEISPKHILYSLSYNLSYSTPRDDLQHKKISIGSILTIMQVKGEVAALSVVPPGMLENKIIGIAQQDFTAKETLIPGQVCTITKTATINGSPAGSYVLKMRSLNQNTSIGGFMNVSFYAYPSIKIEADDGSILASISYPRIGPNKIHVIQDSWMFALGL